MLKKEFDTWWNGDDLTANNPFGKDTPAFWAWEGWGAGAKAEREECAKVCDEVLNQDGNWSPTGHRFAKAIRARSEK